MKSPLFAGCIIYYHPAHCNHPHNTCQVGPFMFVGGVLISLHDHNDEKVTQIIQHVGAWTKQTPDSKVHGANMAPDGPHVGPMNFAIWDAILQMFLSEFPWWKIFGFLLKFHLSLFWKVHLTVIQYCFRYEVKTHAKPLPELMITQFT